MWFKNIRFFTFSEPFTLSAEDLAATCENSSFSPCGTYNAASMGFISPLQQEDAPLVYAAEGCYLLCLKLQEKILPATVLREQVDERVAEITQKEDRKVYKKERQQIKDDLYQELLARALCKSSLMYAYIDTKQQLLIINSSSQTKAELFCSFLRKTLGSLKTIVPEYQNPSVTLTHWLADPDDATPFAVGDFCLLQHPDDPAATIRCKAQDITTPTIQALLEDGNSVTQLGLEWEDQLTFVLTDDLGIQKITYLDSVQAQVDDIFTESDADRFAADFAIMTKTLQHMLEAVVTLFCPQMQRPRVATPA